MKFWISVPLFLLSTSTFASPRTNHGGESNKTQEVDLEPKVAGGFPILIEERPFQVLLKIRWRHSRRLFCGGVIYNQEYVLTAAHCVVNDGVKAAACQIEAYAGKTFFFDSEPGDLKLVVHEVITHEDYDWEKTKFSNDIALLRLGSCLRYNKRIQPLDLVQTHPAWASGPVPATISGWGRAQKEYLNSMDLPTMGAQLQMGRIHFINHQQCVQDHLNVDPATLYVPGTNMDYVDHVPINVPPSAICGSGDDIDTCAGDNGGPLVCELPGTKPALCGIVSFRYGCALGVPGIYTDIFLFKNWIIQKAVPTRDCQLEIQLSKSPDPKIDLKEPTVRVNNLSNRNPQKPPWPLEPSKFSKGLSGFEGPWVSIAQIIHSHGIIQPRRSEIDPEPIIQPPRPDIEQGPIIQPERHLGRRVCSCDCQ